MYQAPYIHASYIQGRITGFMRRQQLQRQPQLQKHRNKKLLKVVYANQQPHQPQFYSNNNYSRRWIFMNRQYRPLDCAVKVGKKQNNSYGKGKKNASGEIEVTCSVIWRVFECWWPRLRSSGRSTCTNSEKRGSRGRGAKRGTSGMLRTDLADWTWL